MAKKQIRKYVFTPSSNSITIPGAWTVEKILLITNVTRGVIMFNFADTANTGGTVTFTPGGILSTIAEPVVTYGKSVSGLAGTAKVQYQSSGTGGGGVNEIQGFGETTLTFTGASVLDLMSSMAATDKISILIEETFTYVRPWGDFGTDAVERTRVAAPQSLIDADFEYGLQPTKWGSYQVVNQYPSVFEQVTPDLLFTSITTDGGAVANIVVNSTAHGLNSGDAITVNLLYSGVTGFGKAQGSFLVFKANTDWFTYYAKGNIGTLGSGTVTSLQSPNTQIRKGGFYTGSDLNITSFTSDGATPSKITLNFGSAHGFVPGMPLLVNANPNWGGNTIFLNLPGSYYVGNILTATTCTFTARGQVGSAATYPSSGSLQDVNKNTGQFSVYARPDGFFTSRPGDGGVILGTGSAIHGAGAIRQTKKYFRYQSGKGYMYTTGVLFAPNYDIVSIGTGSGSNLNYPGYITCVVSVPHGLQIGSTVRVVGVNTPGYDGEYLVARVDNDYQIQFQIANGVTIGQGSTQGNPEVGIVNAVPKLFVYKWHGACIRTGPHDDSNGMFVEYDGLQFNCVKRTSTLQLAGAATFTPNSNTITGDGNCLWTQQLRIGDKIILKGMTHRVSGVTDNNTMSVTPDYRGVSTIQNNYIWRVQEERASQPSFNTDTVDGSGDINNPSGYKLDPNRVQMIGINYTWYGAGFMDFSVRGLDGNYIIIHRMKQNNVNTTASMRSANLPARYAVINEGASTVTNIPYTQSTIGASGVAQLPVDNCDFFPTSGLVLVDTELIAFSSKNTTPGSSYLVISQRQATANVFIGGEYKLFGAGPAATHTAGTGVELVSVTATPTMSHWGSAYIADGGFDFDRGYQFTYTYLNANVTTSGNTVMGLRLSPSASNSITGDLGERDLLNRAQILLNSININVGDRRTGGNVQLLVTGMLNPNNYSETSQVWSSLNNTVGGNQPSFAQVTGNCWFTGQTYAGQPVLAQPGEKLFEFVVDPGNETKYDLTGVKDLSQSGIGGRGTYPNGSDTLYITLTSLPGATTGVTGGTTTNTFVSNVHVTLQWGEAQA
jgi:hypothetical protein